MSIRLTLEKLGISPEIGYAKTVSEIRRNHRGDAKLFHDISCLHGPALAALAGDLEATCRLLGRVDAVSHSHDQVLQQAVVVEGLDLSNTRFYGEDYDGDLLIELADWNGDGAHASLVAAVLACERSVECLEGAQEMLSGIFKGPLRDAAEEPIIRSLKGARAQLKKLQDVLATYEMPARPHEIRRNSISYLIVSLTKAIAGLEELKNDCQADADAVLIEDLERVLGALTGLSARFDLLRERCSQKVGKNLSDCTAVLSSAIDDLRQLAQSAQICWHSASSRDAR